MISIVRVVGEPVVGWLEMTDGPIGLLGIFNLEGEVQDTKQVPLNALEIETRAEWLAAGTKVMQSRTQALRDALDRCNAAACTSTGR